MIIGSGSHKTRSENSKTYHLAFAIALAAGFMLSMVFAGQSFYRTQSIANISLENQINPNYATAASMARLPGIGVSLADRIVKYRENFALKNQNRFAFEKAEDLKNVPGIGPKKTEKIEEFLKF